MNHDRIWRSGLIGLAATVAVAGIVACGANRPGRDPVSRLPAPTPVARPASDAPSATLGWTLTLPRLDPRRWDIYAGGLVVHEVDQRALRILDPATGVERRRIELPEGWLYDGSLVKARRGNHVALGQRKWVVDLDSGAIESGAPALNRWREAGPPARPPALIQDEERGEELYLYQFATSSRVWTTRPLPGGYLASQMLRPDMAYAVRAHQVVTHRDAISEEVRLDGHHVFGLDAQSGQDRWSFYQPGTVLIDGESDGVLCLRYEADDTFCHAGIDGRTGAVLWSISGLGKHVASRGDGFLFLGRGSVQRVDPRTGRTTAIIPLIRPVDDSSLEGPLVLVADRWFLAGSREGGGTVVQAYELPP